MPREAKPYYQTKKFLKLLKQWDKKLARSGFEDVEITDYSTGERGNLLHGITTAQLVRFGADRTQERMEYFRIAEQYTSYLEEVAKYRPRDWRWKAWKLHAEGVSFTQIQKDIGVNRAKVAEFLKEEAKLMMSWYEETKESNVEE